MCYFIQSEDCTAGSKVFSSSSVGFFPPWLGICPWSHTKGIMHNLAAVLSLQKWGLAPWFPKKPARDSAWSGWAVRPQRVLLESIPYSTEFERGQNRTPAKWFSKPQLKVVCFYLLLLSTICATKKRLNSPVEITVTHGGFEPLRIWLALGILSQGRV